MSRGMARGPGVRRSGGLASLRATVVGTLLIGGTLSSAVAAWQSAAPAPKVVEAVKIRDNLYMLNGGGGSTGVFIRSDGVVVIDTKNPGWGSPILEKIREL